MVAHLGACSIARFTTRVGMFPLGDSSTHTACSWKFYRSIALGFAPIGISRFPVRTTGEKLRNILSQARIARETCQ